MNKEPFEPINIFYFIAYSFLVMLGYLAIFLVFSIMLIYVERAILFPAREIMDVLFLYIFFGGYIVTLVIKIKQKVKQKSYITNQCLTEEITVPFFFIFLGSIGLIVIIYLGITMKTGAASGMFFLLPGIWTTIFYLMGVSKIDDIILKTATKDK